MASKLEAAQAALDAALAVKGQLNARLINAQNERPKDEGKIRQLAGQCSIQEGRVRTLRALREQAAAEEACK